MFMENPNKKQSYSFRIQPSLLEKIKNYAKATNQTVPEILNEMIEEKVDGLYLTNDYLEERIDTNSIIGLPPLVDIYNNGNYKEFGLFFENNNRVFYEIQRIPNNLDSWTDTDGYTSKKRGTDHEGISFVLAPELITKPEYLENPELLFCCLVPVYFRVSIKKKSIQVKNISFTNALEKIRNSPNIDLMDEFTNNTNLVKDIILGYHNTYKNAIENPDGTFKTKYYTYKDKNQLLLDTFRRLIIELNEATIKINVNVISHLDGATERQTQKAENNILLSDNPYLLNDEIDRLQNENETLQNRVNELESKFNKLNDLIEKSQDPEYRKQVWEDMKDSQKE